MKLFSIILSTTFFLISCSGTPETAKTDTSVSDTAEVLEEAEEAASEDGGEEKADEEASDTEGVDQKNVKLVVSNQETVGQIVVESVATARDGWVSVHRSQENGGIQLPDSIGEARVDSGNSEGIIVDLWEAPEVGEKLWVLLHIDSGERGKYEFPGEDPAVTKDGKTMARSFVVEGDGEEGKEDE
ncbi:MAG: hypothetical protein ABG776_17765 [Cyanobacteria bacterium J06555_13]